MIRLNVNLNRYLRGWDQISRKIPESIVTGVANTASRARDLIRFRTKQVFNLHSDYIPNSIRSIPDPAKPSAIAAATKGLMGRHHDFKAAVYLRGHSDPKKNLDFMVLHETGGRKRPVKGRALAIPGSDIRQYSGFKTTRGQVRSRWKPSNLLQDYNLKRKIVRVKKNKKVSKSFIIGRSIARWRGENMEFLYQFARSALIKARWGFVSTVKGSVLLNLHVDILKELNKIK